MKEKREEIYNKAKAIINDINILVSSGDADLLEYLVDIEKSTFEDDEIDLIERTISNIENYFKTKKKMVLQINDYDYLRELAETLRNQKVRVEDGVVFWEPVFKIVVNDNSEDFYFITRKGAEEFIKSHSTIYKDIKLEPIKNEEERRTLKIFDVKTNKNLEFAQILDIVKRNF